MKSPGQIEAFELLATAISKFGFLLDPFEKRLMSKYGGQRPRHAPVFVVGAPRVGSTIFNQWLTNTFEVAYFDNIVSLFFRNPLIGMGLSQKLYGKRPHNSYKSKFGRTYPYSLHGPNELGRFLYRFLPKNELILGPENVDENAILQIKRTFNALANMSGAPLVVTNNNMGMRLGLVNEIDPTSRIIMVRRNPLHTSLSILQARIKKYGSAEHWWSIKPPDYGEIEELGYVEQIVRQVHGVQHQMSTDMKRYFPSEHLLINYEDLCNETEKTQNRLSEFLGHEIALRKNTTSLKIKHSSGQSATADVLAQFKSEISKLKWE